MHSGFLCHGIKFQTFSREHIIYMTKSKQLLHILLFLDQKEFKRQIRFIMNNLPPERMAVIEAEIYRIKYRDRYGKVRKWMEGTLAKNPHLTPSEIAWRYITVSRSSRRLFPWCLRIARRVKDCYRKKEGRL